MSNSIVGALRVVLGIDSAQFDRGLKNSKKQAEAFSAQAKVAFAAIATAATAAAVAFGGLADQWSDMNSRLSNVAGSAESGAAAMNRLQKVARASYSSIAQTTDAFISQATTLNALGVSTDKQLDLTETLNNALVVSATRGDKARSVMEAWSKAMALGALRGDDLNSVITNSPRLAKALADSMGVSVNALRKLGEQGKITRAEMLGVTSQMETLKSEAGDMAATIADGWTILSDAVLQLVGRVDQATQASGTFAEKMIAIGDAIVNATDGIVKFAVIVAENFERMVFWAGTFATVMGVQYVSAIGIAAVATGALTTALTALRFAIAKTGIGALVIILADVVFKMWDASEATDDLGKSIDNTAGRASGFFTFMKNGAEALGLTFDWLTDSIASAFVGAFATIYENYANLINLIRSGFRAVGIADMIGMSEGGDMDPKWATKIFNNLTQSATVAGRAAAEKWAVAFGKPLDTDLGAMPSLDQFNAMFGAGSGSAGGSLLGSGSGGGGGGGAKQNAWQQALASIQEATRSLGEQAQAFSMTTFEADRFNKTLELTRAAEEAKMVLSPQLIAQINSEATAYATAAENVRRMTEAQQLNEQMTSRVASGFTDLFEAAVTKGKDFLGILGDIARDLGKMILNKAFMNLFGMGGGSGGGGGIFGGLINMLGFARGGTILPGGGGGIDSQLVAFRKSPNERVDITKPGQTLTTGDSETKEVNINLTVSGARGNAEIRQMVEQGMDSALQTVKQNLPTWNASPRVKFV